MGKRSGSGLCKEKSGEIDKESGIALYHKGHKDKTHKVHNEPCVLCEKLSELSGYLKKLIID